jgi:hypothetical protein
MRLTPVDAKKKDDPAVASERDVTESAAREVDEPDRH